MWKLLSKYFLSGIARGLWGFGGIIFNCASFSGQGLSLHYQHLENVVCLLASLWSISPFDICLDLKISFLTEAGYCTAAMALILGEEGHSCLSLLVLTGLRWLNAECPWQGSCLLRGLCPSYRDTLSAWHPLLGGFPPEQGWPLVPHTGLGNFDLP